MDGPGLTVLTVLWRGDFRGRRYNASWVRRLRNMVARYLGRPHRFVCLSNEPVDGVETVPLESGLPGWWAKIELFRRDYGERMLFLDLDTLVVDDLAPIADYDLAFAPAPHSSLWEGEGLNLRPGIVDHFSSCCMAWDAGEGRQIWEDFTPNLMNEVRGDQDAMGWIMGEVETLPEQWFLKLKQCQAGPPPGVRIVASMPWKNDIAAKRFDWVAEVWQ